MKYIVIINRAILWIILAANIFICAIAHGSWHNIFSKTNITFGVSTFVVLVSLLIVVIGKRDKMV